MLVLLLLCMDSLSNDIQTRGLYAFISLNFHFLSSLTGSIIVERTLEQHKYISVCYSVTEPVCLDIQKFVGVHQFMFIVIQWISSPINVFGLPKVWMPCYLFVLLRLHNFFCVSYSQYLHNGMVVSWTTGMTNKKFNHFLVQWH